MDVYKLNITFQQIEVSILIKPASVYCEKNFQVLIRSKQILSSVYRKALVQYLQDEGYFWDTDCTLEFLN